LMGGACTSCSVQILLIQMRICYPQNLSPVLSMVDG
jgi:hypothetical protein